VHLFRGVLGDEVTGLLDSMEDSRELGPLEGPGFFRGETSIDTLILPVSDVHCHLGVVSEDAVE